MCVKNTSISSNPQTRDELLGLEVCAKLWWHYLIRMVNDLCILSVMFPATCYTALKPDSKTTPYAHEYTYPWLRIA